MTPFYAFFRALIKFSLRLYFKKIRIEGLENIPRNTPLLITPNHQNALIDPLLVGAFTPIPIHYLTRSDVFKWWLKPLLKRVNMMPIYRIRDGYGKLSLNDAVFSNCFKVFQNNESVLIFAEGNHGKEYYLRPLTKGAARLALQSQLKLDQDLMVLPVGLNFFDHQRPQSVVLMRFGKPVSVRDYVSAYDENPARGLISMRDAISDAMKETLVIPDETEDYAQRKAGIFQQKHQDLSFDQLKELNVAGSQIDKRKRSAHLLAKFLNPIPYLIIYFFLRREKDVVFHSTLKFGVGLFAFPFWWAMVFLIFSFTVGVKIALLAVIVMILGLFFSYQR
ncbi:MAG: 1-acyl-sn-glycerol-3-phosphate acyltransferase [Ekhidna sp.]|uniref:1-acyl-sn-glycerol-3-phosphate acyltransferase n=1 Tax=Ekhidna sp. TaxID=2608089 RepID=UPI0032EFD40A